MADAVATREGLRVVGRPVARHDARDKVAAATAYAADWALPGMLLTALAFLEREPRPDREAIRAALEGNLCRCTGYTKIVDAVSAYVREANGDG